MSMFRPRVPRICLMETGWALDLPLEGPNSTHFCDSISLTPSQVKEKLESAMWRHLHITIYEILDLEKMKELFAELDNQVWYLSFIIEEVDDLEDFEHDYAPIFETMKPLTSLTHLLLWDEEHCYFEEIFAGIACLVPQLKQVEGPEGHEELFESLYNTSYIGL